MVLSRWGTVFQWQQEEIKQSPISGLVMRAQKHFLFLKAVWSNRERALQIKSGMVLGRRVSQDTTCDSKGPLLWAGPGLG